MNYYASAICLAAVMIALNETRDPDERRTLFQQARDLRLMMKAF